MMPRRLPLVVWVVDDQLAGALQFALNMEYHTESEQKLISVRAFDTATMAVNEARGCTVDELPAVAVIDLNFNPHADDRLAEEFERDNPHYAGSGKNILGLKVLQTLHERWDSESIAPPRYCLYTANTDAKRIVSNWPTMLHQSYDVERKDAWNADTVFDLVEKYLWLHTEVGSREILLCTEIRNHVQNLAHVVEASVLRTLEDELRSAASALYAGLLAKRPAAEDDPTQRAIMDRAPWIQLASGSPARIASGLTGSEALDRDAYTTLGVMAFHETLMQLVRRWNIATLQTTAAIMQSALGSIEETVSEMRPHKDELWAMPVVGRWVTAGPWLLYDTEIFASTERALLGAKVQDYSWELMRALKSVHLDGSTTQAPKTYTVLAAALHSESGFPGHDMPCAGGSSERVDLTGTPTAEIVESVHALCLPAHTRDRLVEVAQAIGGKPCDQRGAIFKGNSGSDSLEQRWLRPWSCLKGLAEKAEWLTVSIDNDVMSAKHLIDWHGFFFNRDCFLSSLRGRFDQPQPEIQMHVSADQDVPNGIAIEITAILTAPLSGQPNGGILTALEQLAGWGTAEWEVPVESDGTTSLWGGTIELGGMNCRDLERPPNSGTYHLVVRWRLRDYCRDRCP